MYDDVSQQKSWRTLGILVLVVVLVNVLLIGKPFSREEKPDTTTAEATHTISDGLLAQAGAPFGAADPGVVDDFQTETPVGTSLFGLVPYTQLDIQALQTLFPQFTPLENDPVAAFVDTVYNGTLANTGVPPFTPFDRIVYVYGSLHYEDMSTANPTLWSAFEPYLNNVNGSVLSGRNRGTLSSQGSGFVGELVQYHTAESCGGSGCFFQRIRECSPATMVTTYDQVTTQFVSVEGASADGRCRVSVAALSAGANPPTQLGGDTMTCVLPRGMGYVQMLQSLYIQDRLNPEYECAGPMAERIGTYTAPASENIFDEVSPVFEESPQAPIKKGSGK